MLFEIFHFRKNTPCFFETSSGMLQDHFVRPVPTSRPNYSYAGKCDTEYITTRLLVKVFTTFVSQHLPDRMRNSSIYLKVIASDSDKGFLVKA